MKIAEIEAFLAEELSLLHPNHRAAFERIRIKPRLVPVEDSPGETVVVVAEHQGKVLYWSDIEEGWELEPLSARGGIAVRGSNQFTLSHIMHQVFGEP